ncbi:amino acid ABC transporter substrate-binding protein, PAAT family [Pedococcus cremeus]|uniref:Amino acid ABC transporter substrate-binding protein, PAAT family n=1 Tax=Pedococcus cremeus TaxID=587636 RepID=A0A1H9RNG5_9MICO|nr:ABC transporter substrate-binding protein [Pedococcus cremeus]SER73623.1 amino acid ABC transporter substrate-binding protein, PAAT family [Pedococcus cremeus]
MTSRTRPAVMLLAGLASAGLALSACGSDSLSSGGSSTSKAAPSATANADLAAKVPAKIKSKGTITIGVDASYAPNEFLAADGKTVEGFDVDLFNAVAQKFGLKTQWVPANFDSIIVGVQSGKYDVGVSSFTINDKRKKQVNMVSYFNAGTQWAAAKGNPKKVDPNKPCGLKVAVQKGTVQEEEDLPVKAKKCQAEGKPITVLPFTGQDQATAAVATGKADAMLADSPIVAYAVKQSGGKIEAVGDIYDAAPYGYVIPKAETDFANAIVEALKQLDQSGDYKKALSNFGVEAGAISNFAVNP